MIYKITSMKFEDPAGGASHALIASYEALNDEITSAFGEFIAAHR